MIRKVRTLNKQPVFLGWMIAMFGEEILNGKQLREYLGISTTLMYRLIENGLPYHQLTCTGKKYYIVSEVDEWLRKAGYHQRKVWTK